MDRTPRRRRRTRYEAVPAHSLRPRRLLAVASVAVVLIGIVWGARVAMAVSRFGHASLGDVIAVLTGHASSTTGDQIRGHERVNIALYGYGGGQHDGAYLSDSIMLLSIQQRDGKPVQVSEISVPRDWWVPIPLGNGDSYHGRINEAFEDGQTGAPRRSTDFTPPSGGPMANATLSRLLGVHIDHYVGLDFQAFQAAVDAVGGVDVNVPTAFTDEQYPRGECVPGGDCSYTTVHFDAGRQHMDGATALQFSRSRHANEVVEASDFARSRRQQLVVAALKQRALSAGGIGRLPDLLDSLSGHIQTDMSLADMKALYDLTKDADPSRATHVSIDDSNFLYECKPNCDAAVLFPHDRTYLSLQRFVDHALPDPDATAENTGITVLDGSGHRGVPSQRWASLLNGLHFTAADGGATGTVATTRVVDASGGKASRTAAWLGEYFNVAVETVTPPTPAADGANAGVTVELGQDEEAMFNNTSGDPLHD